MVVDSFYQIVPNWLAEIFATLAAEISVEWEIFTKTVFIENDLFGKTKQRSFIAVAYIT